MKSWSEAVETFLSKGQSPVPMKITPHRDMVLVLPDLPPEWSDSGLIIRPPGWAPPPGTGTVIAVGAGRWVGGDKCHNCGTKAGLHFHPTSVQVGDRVSYRWIDGKEWVHEDRTYKFLRENELFLVTETPNAPAPNEHQQNDRNLSQRRL